MNEAEIRRLADALSLEDLVARHPRRAGLATIRAILEAGGHRRRGHPQRARGSLPRVPRRRRPPSPAGQRGPASRRALDRGRLPVAGAAPRRRARRSRDAPNGHRLRKRPPARSGPERRRLAGGAGHLAAAPRRARGARRRSAGARQLAGALATMSGRPSRSSQRVRMVRRLVARVAEVDDGASCLLRREARYCIACLRGEQGLGRRFYEQIDAGNPRRWTISSRRNVNDHASLFPGRPPGREGLKQAFQIFWDATPGRHVIEDQIAEGDRVVTRLTAHGRHEGELPGPIPPTGREIHMSAVAIHRIADGKLAEHWSGADERGCSCSSVSCRFRNRWASRSPGAVSS